MGRTELVVKPFIDSCIIKGYKKGFIVFENGDLGIKAPRWKKGFDRDFEEIHKNYAKYRNRPYTTYSKCKGTLIAAIRKCPNYKEIFYDRDKKLFVFREIRSDLSPGSSGYGSALPSPENNQDYLKQAFSPGETDSLIVSPSEQNCTPNLSEGGNLDTVPVCVDPQFSVNTSPQLPMQQIIVIINNWNVSPDASESCGPPSSVNNPEFPPFPTYVEAGSLISSSQSSDEVYDGLGEFMSGGDESQQGTMQKGDESIPCPGFKPGPYAMQGVYTDHCTSLVDSTNVEEKLPPDLMDIESPPSPLLSCGEFDELLRELKSKKLPEMMEDQNESLFLTRVLPGNGTLLKPVNAHMVKQCP